MYEGYFAVALASANKRVKFGVLLVLAALSAADATGQSLGFVPASSRTRPTVSVRELRIPAKAKSNFRHGLQRLAKHDPEGSKKFFAAAIAEAPDFYEAYYHRAVAEAQLDQNEEALRSFQAAIDLSDGHEPRAEFGYALVLSRVGNASEAERIVRRGLATDANIHAFLLRALDLTPQLRWELFPQTFRGSTKRQTHRRLRGSNLQTHVARRFGAHFEMLDAKIARHTHAFTKQFLLDVLIVGAAASVIDVRH